ncbi:von Willebrand factor type A domain-containing protein [Mycena galericulata]|nr:von Willebrand factor type A domain-containing protein [Mycena galericulata]
MPSIPIYGLYYYYQSQVVSLPLLNVNAEASIKELAAQVKLTQTYSNDATFPIEARYSFPIPARAAVCGFVMIKQDGTRVVGTVLEKQEARETYNAAVAQGQQASLMEQQTPDVFQVSVGNIPSNEQVQIELVYATELAEDEESDSIRFHLPVHIGARFGSAPQSAPTPFRRTVFTSSASPTPFLNIALSVEAIAPISKIGCPSHTVSTELGPDPKLPNFKELPFSNYARVSLSSDSALDKDFVLTIKSAGLDAPRCIAELHPTHDTVALGLTLVPRFKLPDLSRQEFVFLVDRSGSMGGKRIDAAKKALVVMLRALPHQDSLFQIVSFGNRTTFLWSGGSKPYNQETLEEATRHVDGMRADYGGTEIRNALQECFKKRRLDRPMSVLVLTDGDVWDLDGVLNEVKSAVAGAPATAYLRVSVLGIGNSASTAMCEGIARLGNGTCMMVGEEETSFTGKIARMLKAARTPPISNITVDWGRAAPAAPKKVMVQGEADEDDFEMVEQHTSEKPEKKKTLNIFDEAIDDPLETGSTPAPPPPPVVLPPPPAVQQAPFKIQNLFPNIRLNVYAILQGKTIPETVTIRGSTADGAEIALPITVSLSHLQNAPGAPPAIHALAARKIIQDLEDGRHGLAAAIANPDDADLLARTVRASVVRLGKTYSISSTHTSFVAVDESAPAVPVGLGPGVQLIAVQGGWAYAAPLVPVYERDRGRVAGTRGRGGIGTFHSMQQLNIRSRLAPPQARMDVSEGMIRSLTLHHSLASSVAPSAMLPAPGSASPPSDLLAAERFTDSRGPPAPQARHKKRAPPRPSATASSYLDTAAAPPSPSYFDTTTAPPPKPATFGSSRPRPAALMKMVAEPSAAVVRGKAASGGPSGSADPLEALARLQAFDGCFSLDVLSIVKLSTDIQTVRGAFPAGAADAIVATVLAMAFLSTKLGASVERDSWEGMYEKAQQYVEAALQNMGATETADALEAKIVGMLA